MKIVPLQWNEHYGYGMIKAYAVTPFGKAYIDVWHNVDATSKEDMIVFKAGFINIGETLDGSFYHAMFEGKDAYKKAKEAVFNTYRDKLLTQIEKE